MPRHDTRGIARPRRRRKKRERRAVIALGRRIARPRRRRRSRRPNRHATTRFCGKSEGCQVQPPSPCRSRSIWRAPSCERRGRRDQSRKGNVAPARLALRDLTDSRQDRVSLSQTTGHDDGERDLIGCRKHQMTPAANRSASRSACPLRLAISSTWDQTVERNVAASPMSTLFSVSTLARYQCCPR